MGPNYKAIGERIRIARQKHGITQEKLAEMTDLSPSHISHIESGKTKVSLPSLINIANSLNTTIDGLLYDNLDAAIDAYDLEFKGLLEDCTMKEKQIIFESSLQMKDILKRQK